ncbi:MAG: ACP S-malonyltransferase [Verrucomicrobiota bacterium]
MTRKTALLFAGQGAQYVGMGRDFAEKCPSAKIWFDRSRELLGFDLPALCFNGPDADLVRTENAQPAIFLVSWIALQLLEERLPEVDYQAAAGLSLGELTAWTAAEVFTFEDGLQIARQRGRFMQEACDLTQGGMAAILGLDIEKMRTVCQQAEVDMANLNCPGQIVISGESEKVAKACELAKAAGAKRAVMLPVAGAYHSRLMASAKPKVEAMLQSVQMNEPVMMVIANVSARPHTEPPDIRARLIDQVVSSVRWEDSVRYLIEHGFTRFIELGPGTVLSGFVKRIDKNVQTYSVADVASLEATVAALKAGI